MRRTQVGKKALKAQPTHRDWRCAAGDRAKQEKKHRVRRAQASSEAGETGKEAPMEEVRAKHRARRAQALAAIEANQEEREFRELGIWILERRWRKKELAERKEGEGMKCQVSGAQCMWRCNCIAAAPPR